MREILKEARQDKNMTQKDVAEYLGISTRAYQRLESGERIGAIKSWDRLEDLFEISQRELRQADIIVASD